MAFVCFVVAALLAFLAALVGATWITGDADLLKYQFLLGAAAFFTALGLAVGAPPPRRP
jgi:hypothetical protein